MYDNKQTVAGVLVAAGKSTRMGFDKLFHLVNGVEVIRLSLQKLDMHPQIEKLVIVAGNNFNEIERLFNKYPPKKPFCIVKGGETRTHSVKAGVLACGDADFVAIHDAARPFISSFIITNTIAAAKKEGAAAPAILVKDTIKLAENGFVCETLPRNNLRAIQTPQIFERKTFLKALCEIPENEYTLLTDDCLIMEKSGMRVKLVDGSEENFKITTIQDLPEKESGENIMKMRVGHGYDVHKFAKERKLILGGVSVPYSQGLLGHSDADVLLHAVCDAILGAAALGDIGKHFPDNDPTYKNADSLVLLSKVAEIAQEKGFSISNIDATLLCEAPKLAPYIEEMRENIAKTLGILKADVSVKATTEEGLGFTGAKEGIAAHCVVLGWFF